MTEKRKEYVKRIIIDTDIGDDVDDAFAVALALVSPEIQVAGITTVYKDTVERARLALSIVEKYGLYDVPVYAGCGHPLKEPADVSEKPLQYRALIPPEKNVGFKNAVDFLIEEAEKDQELIIVGIGPMTNLAQAFLKKPDVMKKVRYILMGGAYDRVYPEWNILCDPEAAKIVLESGADITIAGLDITAKLALHREQLRAIRNAKGEKAEYLCRLMEIWYERAGFVVLHDPLLIAYLIEPENMQTEPSSVKVELHGEHTRGLAYRTSNWWGVYDRGPVRTAVRTDAERVIALFMERVFGER